jgi:hypothetical protein
MSGLLWSRARNKGAPTLLLAHGAGAPMDSEFMELAASGLSERGVQVARFEFPYMAQRRIDQRKRPPDRQPRLLAAFAEALAQVGDDGAVFIGGKSMGGRMATLLAVERPVAGVVVLGYPFHPPGKPERQRVDHLASMQAPCLVCQGERDALGSRDELTGYALPTQVECCWLADGNHDFQPRQRSGVSWQDNMTQALDQVSDWILKRAAVLK